ncbi:MAG: hypothetical protein ACTHKB_15675 [Burkholderiaceae bacterium]
MRDKPPAPVTLIDPDALESALVEAQLQALRDEPESERGYIGASEIGHPCDRYLWLKFHRYTQREFVPPAVAADDDEAGDDMARMLRLFNRGHREEHVIETALRAAGVEITHDCFEQRGFRVGFFAGHSDGECIAQGEAALLEYKTHSRKSFAKLKRGELKKAFPRHYAQIQVQLKQFALRQAIYIAVCKDNDARFIDVIEYNRVDAEALEVRAETIAASDKPPARIGKLPTSYPCKLCPAVDVCFGFDMPRVNCRNCTNVSKFPSQGTFGCDFVARQGTEHERLQNVQIPPEQKCPRHSFNPYAINDFKGWQICEFHAEHHAVEYERKDGTRIINGAAPFGVPSDELK